MKPVSAVIRAALVAVGFVVAFDSYFAFALTRSVPAGWTWVTVSSLMVSATLIVRRRHLLRAAVEFSPKGAGGGLLLLAIGLSIYLSVTYWSATSNPVTGWIRLASSLLALGGSIWTAFGRLFSRIVLLPLIILALMLPLPIPIELPLGISAAASGAILTFVLISEVTVGNSARVLLAVIAAAGAIVTGLASIPVIVLATTSIVLIGTRAAETLTAKPPVKSCDICGGPESSASGLCMQCAHNVIGRSSSPSLIPVFAGALVLLILGTVNIPIITSNSSPQVLVYSFNGGPSPLDVFSPPGWSDSGSSTSTVNSTTHVQFLANAQGKEGKPLNVSYTLQPFGRPGTASPPTRSKPLAAGMLNGSTGIEYSVFPSLSGHTLLLSWNTIMNSRNGDMPARVMGSFQVSESLQGSFNKSLLASELSEPQNYANALYEEWSSLDLWTQFTNVLPYSLSVMRDWGVAFVGIVLIVSFASKARDPDRARTRITRNLKGLSDYEAKVLLAYEGEGNSLLARAGSGAKELDKQRFYDAVRELVSLGLLVPGIFLRGKNVVFSLNRSYS